LSSEILEERAGTYYSPERAAVRKIAYAEGRLQFQGLDLIPLSNDLFFFEVDPQTRVAFAMTDDRGATGMTTITSSGEYSYDRVEVVPPAVNALAQYVGRYYSPELDITWTLEVQDGCLVALRRKYVDSQLSPLFRDAFSDDWGPLMGFPTTYLVIFERDQDGMVTGLRVSGTSVRHLRFVKQPA
jgi:VCBS repeat-containing protein